MLQLGKYETRQGRVAEVYERYTAHVMKEGRSVDVARYRAKIYKVNGTVETILTFEEEPSGKPLARQIPPPGQRQTSAGEFDLVRMVKADDVQPIVLTVDSILEAAENRPPLREMSVGCTADEFALKVIRNLTELLNLMVNDVASSASEHRRRKTA